VYRIKNGQVPKKGCTAIIIIIIVMMVVAVLTNDGYGVDLL
jgi:hypothetical protein